LGVKCFYGGFCEGTAGERLDIGQLDVGRVDDGHWTMDNWRFDIGYWIFLSLTFALSKKQGFSSPIFFQT
jgi:hypothetical protein